MYTALPVELTQVFPGLPDAASGLVHVGHGRWVDPTWGRPLQPNPAGGLPTLPQALNRYAATPLGQPGVMQAEQSVWNPFTDDVASNVGKALLSHAVNEAANAGIYQYFKASAYTVIGDPIVETITRAVSKSNLAEKAIIRGAALGLMVGDIAPTPLRQLGRSVFDRAVTLNTTFVTEEVIIGYNFSYSHYLPFGRPLGKILSSKLGRELLQHGLDFGIGFGVDVGYQIWLDYSNPYLTSKQIFVRSFVVQGLGSAASFTAGAAVAYFFGPPAWIILGTGIVVSVAWDKWVAPQFNALLGADPTRNLAPLQP